MNLLVGSGDDVIGSILLVGSDEVGVVDRRERNEVLHQGSDLSLKIELEDLGSSHSLIERQGGDIPSSENEVVGVTGGGKWERANVSVERARNDARVREG